MSEKTYQKALKIYELLTGRKDTRFSDAISVDKIDKNLIYQINTKLTRLKYQKIKHYQKDKIAKKYVFGQPYVQEYINIYLNSVKKLNLQDSLNELASLIWSNSDRLTVEKITAIYEHWNI